MNFDNANRCITYTLVLCNMMSRYLNFVDFVESRRVAKIRCSSNMLIGADWCNIAHVSRP